MMLSFHLRLTLYWCLFGCVIWACDIAKPCEHGDTSVPLKAQVQKLHDVIRTGHFVEELRNIADTEELPGSKKMCPLPHLPSKLKRKSRFKATLRHFYSDFAAYYLLVDKIKDTHARCASSLDQKVVLPMCDILCLSFKHMKSKKKAKQIANKLDKKYGDFAVTDNNTCQIFQPVTILESLTAYVQNALPKLMDKKQNRRSKRKTKSMSKRRKRKQKRKRGPGRRNKKRKTGENKSGRRRA